MDTLARFQGEDPVRMIIVNTYDKERLELPPANYCKELAEEISAIIGSINLNIEEIA